MSELVRAFVAAWAALRFWVLNLPTLIRLTWFPLALPSLAAFGWFYWHNALDLAAARARAAGRDLQPMPELLPPMGSDAGVLLWIVLHLIGLSAAAIAVHRFVVAGERRGFFDFRFGRAERAYFAMGLTAYALMIALIAGQYAAQLELPSLDLYFVTSVVKPYVELGPLVLSMFAFPGELPIFDMPPLNYALWCALVIAMAALLIRIAPWPAAVAAEESYALRETLALTRGRPLTVLAFFAGIAVAGALLFALLSIAGLSYLATNPSGLDQAMKSLVASNDGAAAAPPVNVEVAAILAERGLAMAQEIARYLSGLVGVTLGATLVSRLYLLLRAR